MHTGTSTAGARVGDRREKFLPPFGGSAKNAMPGPVVWITGLSGAGKTTLAHGLREVLLDRGITPVLLDGDRLRAVVPAVGGYTPADRRRYAMFYGRLARELSAQGHFVICATISLFHEVHRWNREHLPQYLEVLLRVPVEELGRRDTKGVYAASRHDVVGVHQAAEFPSAPDLTIDNFGGTSPGRAVASVVGALEGKGYL